MNPAQMAGGTPPQQQPPQGQNPQVQATPGQATTNNPQVVIKALEAAIQQCVNPQGYVDINRLVAIWPMISQKMGINIPFQTVLQMIQQNPQMIEEMIVRMGLAGIIKDGQVISGEQMLGMGTGAVAGGR